MVKSFGCYEIFGGASGEYEGNKNNGFLNKCSLGIAFSRSTTKRDPNVPVLKDGEIGWTGG
jgi:hypothetical protein